MEKFNFIFQVVVIITMALCLILPTIFYMLNIGYNIEPICVVAFIIALAAEMVYCIILMIYYMMFY